MKAELGVSLIQFTPLQENKSINLRKLENIIQDIPSETDLVILPEMFSTGYSLSVETLSEDMSGPTVTWMREMAISKKTAVCGSLIIREREKYYNRLVFVFPDGTYQHYDKRHLFRYAEENKEFTAGKQRLIVDYLGWRICPLICYDLRFPIWSANRYDYDLLIYIANWPESRKHAWDSLLVARAIENQSYTIGVNRTGEGDSIFYAGRSKIINFKGETMLESLQVQEEMLNIVLDFDHLHKYRKKYDFMQDADKFGIFY